MSNRRRFIRHVLCVGLLLAAPGAFAQTVYKCVDANGHTAYQQGPCATTQHEQRMMLAPPPARPAVDSAPPAKRPSAKPSARAATRPRTMPNVVQSYECRSRSGAVFYRHSGCPGSIQRRDVRARGGIANDRVSATRVPRSEACQRMRSAGRDGREYDETVSTYERNLGRDPCRRH